MSVRRRDIVPRLVLIGILFSTIVASTAPPNVRIGGPIRLYDWEEAPENLVQNPSFESLDPHGKPSAWVIGSPDALFPHSSGARDGIVGLRIRDGHLSRHTPMASQALPLASGWYTLRGWAKSINAGTNTKQAGGRLNLWGTGAVSPLIRGTTEWTRLERRALLVPPGTSPILRVEAYGRPDGELLFDDLGIYRQLPPPVETFLLYPNYRGLLLEGAPQILRASVTTRPEELRLTLRDVLVRLSVVDERDGHVHALVDIAPSAPSTVVSIETATLPEGVFQLRTVLTRRHPSAPLFEYPPYRIVKLRANTQRAPSTYIDSENVLVMHGRRRFVLGLYDTGGYWNHPQGYDARIRKIAEAPFNLYLNYWLGGAPVQSLNALMTTLSKYGMGYLHTVNLWYPDHSRWPRGTTCGNNTADRLGQVDFTACMAAALGSNPGLVGWYTADEQPADHAARVFGQYTLLRANDPDGITFVAQNRPRELSRWRDAADVIGVDPYPIYNVPEDRPSPLEMVTAWVTQAQDSVERHRPVWAVIQFFKFGSRGHWPTYNELRTMSYMAIVAGAKGVLFWSYGAKALASVSDPVLQEEYWQRLVRLTREIKSLEDALLSVDAPEILTTYTPSACLRVLAKHLHGHRYLIAVNNCSTSVQATLELTEPAASVTVLSEQRALQLSDSRAFVDSFTPYATHIYHIPVSSSRHAR
jgi:hypothetical protein